MASLETLPAWQDPVLTRGGTSLEQNYYAFLKSIVAVVADLTARTEMVTSTTTPTTADITAGQSRIWKNTGAGTVRLYVNDGGVLKSTLLS
ncbi:MAG: hypothetical protein Q7T60_17225 [Sphingopyxis sp.]|nr:hypothetical protein [Sphingopyxis sp.]